MKNKKHTFQSLLSTALMGFLTFGGLMQAKLLAEEAPQTSSNAVVASESVQTQPDGTKIIKKHNGTIIQIKPDGTKLIQHPNGTSIQINPDGSKVITKKNGTIINVKPDGTKTIQNPDDAKSN